MSASVATEASLKAHNSSQSVSTHMDASRSLSSSPNIDDQNSSIDFEEELQQELENEMSASYDNLFDDDIDEGEDGYADTRSFTGISTTGDREFVGSDNDSDGQNDRDNSHGAGEYDDAEGDADNDDDNIGDAVDDDLFGDGGTLGSDDDDDEDEDDLDLDFEDPPETRISQGVHSSTNGASTKVDEDSASDDEFEAVDLDLDTLQAELDGSLVDDSSVPKNALHMPLNEYEPQKRKRSRNRIHVGDADLLERYKDEHPSLVLHLFDSHFRFEGQEGVFLYNGPMRFFFEALNAGKIPIDLVDVLAQVNCRYFDGCLIVQVHDHRRPTQEPKIKKQRISSLFTWSSFSSNNTPDNANRIASNAMLTDTTSSGKIPEPGSIAINGLKGNEAPQATTQSHAGAVEVNGIASDPSAISSVDPHSSKVYKKVMRPTSETVNLDLLLACERSRTKLSQDDVLELESMILLAVEEPLDLEPDFQVSRVSNAIRFVEYGHLLPHKKRKYNSAEIEAEQAEREEKLKLLTLMDDRKNREFQPSFNRVAQVNEWRHKKYVSDAEVYPAAVPPAPAGKKAPTKKSRSQMSLLSDGRRVIRTLRFVQTINGHSTHTVFHVLELPDNRGLQGIMRWGTLPDTSINGGSKTFSFPDEEIMRMHIDNFKLLLSIENNRLIYDSIYPNGVPTAGPPPTSPVAPASLVSSGPKATAPSTPTLSSAPTASPTVANGSVVASATIDATSPVPESAAPSPIVPEASPSKSDTPKQKMSSVAKNSSRGSRKRSPQPKQKKSSASNNASVEPEDNATTAIIGSSGSQKSKSVAASVSSAKSKKTAASRDTTPAIKDEEPKGAASSAKESALTNDEDVAAEKQTETSGGGKQSAELQLDSTTVNEGAKLSAKEKKTQSKGGAKPSRKRPPPKEKKPRGKGKAASAASTSNATSQPKADAVAEASNAPELSAASNTKENKKAETSDKPLAQNVESEQNATDIMANDGISVTSSVAGTKASMQSQTTPAPQTPTLSASQANPQQSATNIPLELPRHITKEYLQANPQYYAILRNQMAQLLMQRQQQQQQGVPNVGSPNPLASPQIRPGAPPNMAVISQMLQAIHGNTAPSGRAANAEASPGTSASTLGASPAPAASSTPHANPGLISPTIRPNLGAAAGNQQLQPTKEDMILIQQYCRIMEIPVQNLQALQFAMLVNKAKTGELKQAIIARIQALSQQQQQAAASGANRIRPNNGTGSGAVDTPSPVTQNQQLLNSNASAQNSPAPASSLPAGPSAASNISSGNSAAANVQASIPMQQLPQELANLSAQDRARLMEMAIQRQRESAINGTAAQMPGASASLQALLPAAIALRQQQQRNAAMSAAGNTPISTMVVNPANIGIQSPAVRPMRPSSSSTGSMQTRPATAAMASPTPTPATAPTPAQLGLSAGQQQLLQQMALSNMSPQQRQEFLQKLQAMQQIHHMQQQQQQQQQTVAAAAPRPPQNNLAMFIQQYMAGRLNPAMLPPQAIVVLLQNAQAQLTPEQRQVLQQECVDVTKAINQASPAWKQQKSASRFAMPPLAQQSSVYDRINRIIVPYGGQSPSTFSQANHLAVYSTQYQAWGASNIVDTDPRRYLHTAVIQESSGDMVIFGGASDSTTVGGNGTRWLNVNRMVLDSIRHAEKAKVLGHSTQSNNSIAVGNILTDSGDATPELIMGLVQHSSVLVNDTLMIVLGGNIYNKSKNEAVNLPFDKIYIYNIDTMKWNTVACSGDIPPERSAFSASLYEDSIYIYGGVNVSGWSQLFGDLYKLDMLTWTWTKLPTPNAPAPRYAHQMKTLGQYLIITNGYINIGGDNYTGDKDMYFYNLNARSFVSKYLPGNTTHTELDTEWAIWLTPATKAISGLCYVLTLIVFILALYYLTHEIQSFLTRRAQPAARAPPGRDSTIRSIVESYADNIISSAHRFEGKYIKPVGDRRRSSHDVDGATLISLFSGRKSSSMAKGAPTIVTTTNSAIDPKSSSSRNRLRTQSVSDGTSTVVGSGNSLSDRRHSSGVLESIHRTGNMNAMLSETAPVRRKLTISAPVPTYRARRASDGPNIRFSHNVDEQMQNMRERQSESYDEIDDYDDDYAALAEDGCSQSSISSIGEHIELSVIDESPEDIHSIYELEPCGNNFETNTSTACRLKVVNSSCMDSTI
ncbi:Transcription factor spt20 [Coemansia spiralis]|uniref:Transcription factor spt20 n=1 Tax=Coemansia spiralis TaxID=417178 RepID=A0A9W8KW60_9FUNG|nr:Transcription factor spt20 [Coemansia spiralis]